MKCDSIEYAMIAALELLVFGRVVGVGLLVISIGT